MNHPIDTQKISDFAAYMSDIGVVPAHIDAITSFPEFAQNLYDAIQATASAAGDTLCVRMENPVDWCVTDMSIHGDSQDNWRQMLTIIGSIADRYEPGAILAAVSFDIDGFLKEKYEELCRKYTNDFQLDYERFEDYMDDKAGAYFHENFYKYLDNPEVAYYGMKVLVTDVFFAGVAYIGHIQGPDCPIEIETLYGCDLNESHIHNGKVDPELIDSLVSNGLLKREPYIPMTQFSSFDLTFNGIKAVDIGAISQGLIDGAVNGQLQRGIYNNLTNDDTDTAAQVIFDLYDDFVKGDMYRLNAAPVTVDGAVVVVAEDCDYMENELKVRSREFNDKLKDEAQRTDINYSDSVRTLLSGVKVAFAYGDLGQGFSGIAPSMTYSVPAEHDIAAPEDWVDKAREIAQFNKADDGVHPIIKGEIYAVTPEEFADKINRAVGDELSEQMSII